VHLKITAESGRVLAEIRADNIATRSLIEAGLPELKTALAGRGLVVEAIAVSADVGSRLEGNSTRPRWSWEGPARHRASGTRPGVHGVRATGPSAISWFCGGRMHVVDCMA
ncbi:MAG: flagellar hook-length control protein FliK, partial [Bacillota bacterium]